MDKLVYTALTGLKSRMDAQATVANNIANATTIGYRADRINFQQALLKGQGFESRSMAGESVPDFDRQAGTIIQTGRDLDVAVTSDSWITVQAKDGTEAYTRRGDLNVSTTGVLETGDGFPVMGSGGPITVPPYDKISVAQDGSVMVVPKGSQPGTPPQKIDQIKLTSADGTKTAKGLDNLLHVVGGGVLPADATAQLRSGSLEQSNVNLTQSLVDMIEIQRAYEVQANMVKEAKKMDESSAALMRING